MKNECDECGGSIDVEVFDTPDGQYLICRECRELIKPLRKHFIKCFHRIQDHRKTENALLREARIRIAELESKLMYLEPMAAQAPKWESEVNNARVRVKLAENALETLQVAYDALRAEHEVKMKQLNDYQIGYTKLARRVRRMIG